MLPLDIFTKIHLPRRKGDRQEPDKLLLRLQDGSIVIEGEDIDDIAAQLRSKYPDATYERYLRHERDYESEQRKSAAMDALVSILVRAAVEELRREQKSGP